MKRAKLLIFSGLSLFILLVAILISASDRYRPGFRLDVLNGLTPYSVHETPSRTTVSYLVKGSWNEVFPKVKQEMKREKPAWTAVVAKSRDSASIADYSKNAPPISGETVIILGLPADHTRTVVTIQSAERSPSKVSAKAHAVKTWFRSIFSAP